MLTTGARTGPREDPSVLAGASGTHCGHFLELLVPPGIEAVATTWVSASERAVVRWWPVSSSVTPGTKGASVSLHVRDYSTFSPGQL